MDKSPSPPPALSPEEVQNFIRELREITVRYEELARKNMASPKEESEQTQHEMVRAGIEGFAPLWMPPGGRDGLINPGQTTRKVRKIDSVQTNQHDILTRLRSAWLGRVYTNHLKSYTFVRCFVQWILRKGYPFYLNHLQHITLSNRKAKRWRPLTRLSGFAERQATLAYKLADSATVETPIPQVFPASDQSYLVSPHDRYTFPEIFVAIIKNGMTYGGTNLILAGGEVICHDLYDFERDFTSEELHGRELISPKSKSIRWLLHDKAPTRVPIAATFVDACACNYAHWLTEVLPRICLFCSDKRFKGIPIVVNDGMHPNIMESLFLVAEAEREIITLPIGRALAVDELYLTSVTGYVPFERRANMLADHSHGRFSPKAFDALRQCIVGSDQELVDQSWPKKIYLRRNFGTRKMVNSKEIEYLLVSQGFTVIETERLTFQQQIDVFSRAEIIISPTGSACANAIFCKPNSYMAILMAKHEKMVYRYWLNMLATVNVKVDYVLGDIVEKSDLGIHGDFRVSPEATLDLLGALEE